MAENQKFNPGLALLRSLMCFMVISCHFEHNTTGLLEICIRSLRGSAVPVFMLMSFVLMQKSLKEHDKQKMKLRFERLIIPLVGWAIIYWVLYFFFPSVGNLESRVTIREIFIQIFLGHSDILNPPMWYQTVLIWLTAIFLCIICITGKYYRWVLGALAIIALFIQYSGLNIALFGNLSDEFKWTFGWFFEMVPIAVTGFLIAESGILNKLKEHRVISLVSAFGLGVAARVLRPWLSCDGYGYHGICKIIAAVAIFVIFYLLPTEYLNPRIKKFIGIITKYTMGIYAMHMLVGRIISKWLTVDDLIICILIYVVCYIIAFFGEKLTFKTKFKYLFE